MTTPYRTSGAVAPARDPWWLRWLAAVAGPFLPPRELAAYRWYRRAIGGRWSKTIADFERVTVWKRVIDCPVRGWDELDCDRHRCFCPHVLDGMCHVRKCYCEVYP